MNPSMRLGAGQDGTPQSFAELKKHPWLQDDWDIDNIMRSSVLKDFQPNPIYATDNQKRKLGLAIITKSNSGLQDNS